MMLLANKLVFLAFVLAVGIHAETYKEVHPKIDVCSSQCYEKYWVASEKSADKKCDACCSGCKFLAMGGLTSNDDNVHTEEAQQACYKTCKESGKDEESCHVGCDLELAVAKKELENLNMDFLSNDMGMGGLFNSLFNSLPFGFPAFGDSVTENTKEEKPKQKQVQIPVIDMSNVEPKAKTGDDKQQEEVGEDDFWKLLMQQLGLIDEDPKKSGSKDSGDKKTATYVTKKEGFVARNDMDGRFGFDNNDDEVAYLRSLWRDRNTVQILLISSITACLFAILWMLCNSSNDPIRRNNTSADEEPPSYNVIYGDEKKLPILIVAGVEDQAGELPDKVPFGHSTKI